MGYVTKDNIIILDWRHWQYTILGTVSTGIVTVTSKCSETTVKTEISQYLNSGSGMSQNYFILLELSQ